MVNYVFASAALPGLFEPLIDNDKTLIDGGVLINLDVEGAI